MKLLRQLNKFDEIIERNLHRMCRAWLGCSTKPSKAALDDMLFKLVRVSVTRDRNDEPYPPKIRIKVPANYSNDNPNNTVAVETPIAVFEDRKIIPRQDSKGVRDVSYGRKRFALLMAQNTVCSVAADLDALWFTPGNKISPSIRAVQISVEKKAQTQRYEEETVFMLD